MMIVIRVCLNKLTNKNNYDSIMIILKIVSNICDTNLIIGQYSLIVEQYFENKINF